MNAKISQVLSEVQHLENLIERLSKTDSFPKIEVDLALSKTLHIYDLLLQIDNVQNKSSFVQKEEPFLEEKRKLQTPAKTIEAEVPAPAVVKKTIVSVPEQEEIRPEPISEEIKESNEDMLLLDDVAPTIESPAKTEHKEEISAKTVESHILAEKFKRTDPLINEVLARGGKRDLTSMMQSKPVNNIESSIGINERFEFIHELFNGDAPTFTKTIKILDSSSNFNEAFNYLNQTFSWDFESETVHKLLDLVRRRYIRDQE